MSGSYDNSVKVWAMGAGASWPCERTLVGHDGRAFPVNTLATWQGKVLSGSADKSVRVWDMETGAHDATLTGHDGSVWGLVVHGDRLLSASDDGTIREWALEARAALRTVEAYEGKGFPYCLAVSGSKLISGSATQGGAVEAERFEVRVWDLGTLECEHTLQQPVGSEVYCLAAGPGQVTVYGGVGVEVVVWGRA